MLAPLAVRLITGLDIAALPGVACTILPPALEVRLNDLPADNARLPVLASVRLPVSLSLIYTLPTPLLVVAGAVANKLTASLPLKLLILTAPLGPLAPIFPVLAVRDMLYELMNPPAPSRIFVL